mgnify:CR=1 FL=1
MFTSDIFGYAGFNWSLYAEIGDDCLRNDGACSHEAGACPVPGIVDFARRIMTSNRALHYAVDAISRVSPRSLAPQHGGIIYREADVQRIVHLLRGLTNVGIDGYTEPT